MTPQHRYVRGDVTRRQRLRLDQKFPLLSFQFTDGLRAHLLAACGGENGFGLAMGNVLHRHACGVWGPVAREDRVLNAHILATRRDGHRSGRWVMSWHAVAGVWIEIATDLATGETRIRRPARTPTRVP